MTGDSDQPTAQAERDLIALGLEMVRRGVSGIPAEDIHAWLLAEDERVFPTGQSSGPDKTRR